MAKPGELAELVAEIFGAEVATVRQQARMLRDHGYMQKEKAGRGAGNMNARDAASLLIAAAGTSSVNKSPAVLAEPGHFVSKQGRWMHRLVPLPELCALPEDHTLIDAVATLIDIFVQESPRNFGKFDEEGKPDLTENGEWMFARVVLIGPIPTGAVRITRIQAGAGNAELEFEEGHLYDRLKGGSGNLSHFPHPTFEQTHVDLRTEHTFTHVGIMRVADLLRRDA